MDPNNNQPIGTNPTAQTVPQPAAPAAPATPPVASQTPPSTPVGETTSASPEASAPKKSNKKWFILLLILLLLAAGIAAYVLYAKNQMDNTQKATTQNSSTVLPTPTLIPTLAPEEDLEVASPEADLLDIEADVKAL